MRLRRARHQRRLGTVAPTVHLFDLGGVGGVYQHTVAVALELAGANRGVVLHSANVAELRPDGVEFCGCVRWFRRLSPVPVRRIAIVAHYAVVTLPHLLWSTRGNAVAHVQGAAPLCSIAALGTSLAKRATVYSPHNTFSRQESRLEFSLIRLAARRADLVVVFSERDREVVTAWGARATLAPLVQYVPDVAADRRAWWSARLGGDGGDAIAVFAGQIRHDKGPLLFVEAMALIPQVRAAIVGPDYGALAATVQRAAQLGVDVEVVDEYLPLAEFVAAVAASDVVVTPYQQASQSGVLAIAKALCVASVSSDVGGLAALSTFTVTTGEPADYAAAILRAIAGESTTPVQSESTAVGIYSGVLARLP